MLVKMIKKHLKNMDPEHKLVYIVNLLWNSQYSWGNERLGDTDCSGTICWGLYLMGFNIRITAEEMANKMTDPHKGAPSLGNLLFFKHEDRDTMRHVALFVEKDILLNAQFKATYRRWEEVIAERHNQPFEIHQINWNKVLTLSNNKEMYGLDEEITALFGIFS